MTLTNDPVANVNDGSVQFYSLSPIPDIFRGAVEIVLNRFRVKFATYTSKDISNKFFLRLQRRTSKIHLISYPKIVSEYDQEIPQSQTADKPMAP